jgi:hypothetical protein
MNPSTSARTISGHQHIYCIRLFSSGLIQHVIPVWSVYYTFVPVQGILFWRQKHENVQCVFLRSHISTNMALFDSSNISECVACLTASFASRLVVKQLILSFAWAHKRAQWALSRIILIQLEYPPDYSKIGIIQQLRYLIVFQVYSMYWHCLRIVHLVLWSWRCIKVRRWSRDNVQKSHFGLHKRMQIQTRHFRYLLACSV